MYHVPLTFDEVMEMGMGRRGDTGDYLASSMQMTWFVWQVEGRTKGNGGRVC